MIIRVNGEDKEINAQAEKITLSETIKLLGYDFNTVVVELNNLIVNSESWANKKVRDGDKLEIVSIVGGG